PLFVEACATAVNEINALANLSAYPNPASSTAYFTLEMTEATALQMDLLTIDGRLVQPIFSGEIPAGQTTLSADVSGLSAGIYLYRLVGESGVKVGRLVVGR